MFDRLFWTHEQQDAVFDEVRASTQHAPQVYTTRQCPLLLTHHTRTLSGLRKPHSALL